MEIEIILTLAAAGIALGLFEGIRPGPLLTMVIRETLTGGWYAGARAASAPIFTDGPLIIVSIFLSGWIAEQPSILFVISLLGAGFLVWFGIDCFRIEAPDPDTAQEAVTGSFRRGVITNLLNPNVYVFWFLIGGPLMASAADEEPLAPVAYALSFLVTIIIVKMAIALIFDRTRGSMSPRAYKIALGICGLGMIGFSAGFLYQAYELFPEAF
jgi:threonine/homoserine/homoserine lactone efflux protein|tara:strand:+ start:502 stop:1140 length:639 start_codon:yes stop_codon:yes gene_type:complete